MVLLRTTDADFAAQWRARVARNPVDATDLQIVEQILSEVEREGEAAVLRWSAHFDRSNYASLDAACAVPERSWLDGVNAQLRRALELAADRIREFHSRQKPQDFSYSDAHGNHMGNRWLPMRRAGLYVPGGKAAYPSSVLMNAIPAKVAGVSELVVVTPPGYMKPEVKAAAWLAGVDRVIAVGGVQAIGLLAYGAGTQLPVDVIVGPGNRYVAAAKRKVFGRVQIDMIAGPSEILVLADGSVPAHWIAADLLSQAEHDEAAVCGLVTTDAAYGEAVMAELARRAAATPRRTIAEAAVQRHAFVVLARDRAEMVALSNAYAPEHLELAVQSPEELLTQITEAGSVFVGPWTPEAVGDYVAGPNHVLPTSGSARFFSPLGVDTFMKRSGWTQWNEAGLKAYGSAIVDLAEAEELSAHADSVRVRL